MPSISYHEQSFFKNYFFLSIPWIKFSHLFDDFKCSHPHYIFHRSLTWGSHSHFLQVWYTTNRSYGWNIIRLNTSFCFSPYCSNPPYLFFFPLLSMICILLVVFHMRYSLFMITNGICNIKIFHLVGEMCSWFPQGLDSSISLPQAFVHPTKVFVL
jgi:hypothetical protein